MLPNHAAFDLDMRVIHGLKPGKRLFICATIHGDELNGIEIIRRVLASSLTKHIHGTLIAIPIVNLFGMLLHSRYLPDRRDLNRSFPGSEAGSSAAQLANTFLTEVVAKCTHGIDLHTGSNNRLNLPQIRCGFEHDETLRLALSFGAPVILKSKIREGSLREAAENLGIPTLTFEGGEALRFNEFAVRAGVAGILRVMSTLKMIPAGKCSAAKGSPVISPSSRWLRSPMTGVLRSACWLGDKVLKGDVIAKISDPLGTTTTDVVALFDGIVIGRTQNPLVYKGDALFNIAWVSDPTRAQATIEAFEEEEFEEDQFNLFTETPLP
ncbi:MAG: succinylglutamate desuccinylase/aspartoacylase family protein [Alphaproteobacteria bacterium]|nr:succinylglutamate desuccinylase/aspartoacylase family protein [Alphaproteobacteria bacterium]